MRKIAILSNVTTDLLVRYLPSGIDVWTPPGHDTWVQIALAPPAEMKSFAPECISILLESRFSASSEEYLDDAVRSLRSFFPGVPVLVPSMRKLAEDFGEAFYDERMWKLARMPWSCEALRTIAGLFKQHKALAVDLDGTLWSAVASEDGSDAVVPDTHLQRSLKQLRDRGVLLTVVSKNDIEDVEGVFRRDDMILRQNDFSAFSVNWDEKSSNIAAQASALGIGVEDFLFIDDNPVERARMRSSGLGVTVSEFPPDIALRFTPSSFTAEDTMRAGFYEDEKRRASLASSLPLEDYLAALELNGDFGEAGEGDFERLAQLSQRSNRFNLCTNRYSVGDLRNMSSDGEHILFRMSAGDRFGTMGTVAFALVRVTGEKAMIEDFVMSCRAIGRTLEFAFAWEIEKSLAGCGITVINARRVESAKNAMTADFYDSLGYRRISEKAGETMYFLEPGRGSMPVRHFFTIGKKE